MAVLLYNITITLSDWSIRSQKPFNLTNIIATVSFISSVKNSPANGIKISAAILNFVSFSLFNRSDSDKLEKINIFLLSGCSL